MVEVCHFSLCRRLLISNCSGISLGVYVCTWCGEDTWIGGQSSQQRGHVFNGPTTDPVYFQGEFYCLGSKGDLVISCPGNGTGEILERLTGTHSEVEHGECTEKYYLMEIEDELISFFHGIDGLQDPIRVFELDESGMVWNKVEDLGNLMLFLGHRTGIARPPPFEGCANRIYLPRFDDDSKFGVYFSMETHSYEPKVLNMTQPFSYVWVELNFN